ncbi:glycerophosphodiester phosphodiesterase [Cellulosilyticum sp. I15G10I2]|uniref:glycerophosphodiester phosphodiesterase n=1 Tax=Cellulosilyticum sp. I15G10I2 TaxID=1892843 RepID=UPI00085CD13D|nr:glycerophosphodiester phosphodiesterase [Cellulosilyticum sp. I15G10I2]
MVLNCAHRGASAYYPENTMLAFRKAIELGCDAIETDIHVSKDGRLVLIHDDKVDRTTNKKGDVKDYTFKELERMGVPSLEQLIVLAKRYGIILNLELKSGPEWYDGIEEKIVEAVKRYHIIDTTIISSFNHYALVKCKELCPQIQIGLIYVEAIYKPEKYCEYAGAEAIHPFYLTLTNQEVEALHGAGFKVRPFTVNSEGALRRMIEMDVDMIITDYPDRLKRILKGYKMMSLETVYVTSKIDSMAGRNTLI